MNNKPAVYRSSYAESMYTYFVTYDETCGAPSFSKFAQRIGVSPDDVERFRSHKEFERTWRACNEIRRDYLIDHALNRRFDPSFVKYLLSTEYAMAEEGGDNALAVTLEVVG